MRRSPCGLCLQFSSMDPQDLRQGYPLSRNIRQLHGTYGLGCIRQRNRNPIVIVNGEKGLNPIIIEPETEEELQLNASKSVDPDKDKLTFHWWILPEAGTYTSTVSIREADKANAILRIPQDAAGKELHIICEVTDNGTPALTSYRRVIIRPKLGETFNLSGQR